MPPFKTRIAAILGAALLATAPACAADIEGKATIVDAGTIEVGDTRIHLYGIAALAPDQICTADGKPWNCGQQATWALAFELAEHWLICRDKGAGSAVCFIGGIHDVGERMVRKGWARASANDYVAAEAEARAARAGQWRGGPAPAP
jgi:endonuclease YncB( thermonuclease family)